MFEVYMKRPEATAGYFDASQQVWTIIHADGTKQQLTQEEFDNLYLPLPEGVRVETTVVDSDEDPE